MELAQQTWWARIASGHVQADCQPGWAAPAGLKLPLLPAPEDRRPAPQRSLACACNIFVLGFAQVALDIAKGLVFLHSRRVVHFGARCAVLCCAVLCCAVLCCGVPFGGLLWDGGPLLPALPASLTACRPDSKPSCLPCRLQT